MPGPSLPIRVAVVLAGVGLAASCSASSLPDWLVAPPTTTVARFERGALEGQTESQAVLGYLFATGQGVGRDEVAARFWLEQAAAGGHVVATLNLAALDLLGSGEYPDSLGAERNLRAVAPRLASMGLERLGSASRLLDEVCSPEPTEAMVGRDVFEVFCAGCHGRYGVAEHVLAPSFAFGERMGRPDDELLGTVEAGHGSMPRWDDKLPAVWLEEALRYARGLQVRYGIGLIRAADPPNPSALRFGSEREFASSGADPGPAYDSPRIRALCAGRSPL